MVLKTSINDCHIQPDTMAPSLTKTLESAIAQFRDSINSSYELDEEFVSALCTEIETIFTPVLKKVQNSNKKRQKRKGPKKVSGYNVFIKQGMVSASAEEKTPTEKISELAQQWKDMDDAAKQPFKDQATAANEEALAAWNEANPATEEEATPEPEPVEAAAPAPVVEEEKPAAAPKKRGRKKKAAATA